MSFVLDAHTHTIASGHAYSTMPEMVDSAVKKGLLLLGIAEHAPAMPGTCNHIYFQNLKIVPRQQKGIKLMLGAEANIMDFDGSLDLDEQTINCLDYIIASMHKPCLTPGSKTENTRACIKAMENPRVSVIGHPDDGLYPLDYDELVRAAKENRCLLEINNSSLNPKGFRSNARQNLTEMLELCAKYDTAVIAGSDAHIEFDVGNFCFVNSLLEETGFPMELVVNNSVETFLSYIK